MAKTPPFEQIYAVVTTSYDERRGKHVTKKKIYDKLSTARACVTRQLDDSKSKQAKFAASVELWAVGEAGWVLEFAAEAGDHYSSIPWHNAVEGNVKTKKRVDKYAAKVKRERELKLYEELRAKFES